MKSPHLVWAAVAIVFMLVTGAVLLVLNDKDISVLLALAGLIAVPVLGAFGVTIKQELAAMNLVVGSVKDVVNGERSLLLGRIAVLQDTVKELALQVPSEVEGRNDLSSSVLLRESEPANGGQIRADAPRTSAR
jgi:hypothetical protein